MTLEEEFIRRACKKNHIKAISYEMIDIDNWIFETRKGYGIINVKTGEVILPFKYYHIRKLDDSVFFGVTEKRVDSEYLIFNLNTKSFITGKKYTRFEGASENRVVVGYYGRGFGYIDEKGNEITPCQYALADTFRDGTAVVYKPNNESKRNRGDLESINTNCGIIDKNGNEILPCTYYGKYTSSKYLILGENNNPQKLGVFDRQGKNILPCKYVNIDYFNGGNDFVNSFKVTTASGEVQFFDENGKRLVDIVEALKQNNSRIKQILNRASDVNEKLAKISEIILNNEPMIDKLNVMKKAGNIPVVLKK